jgi:hypothetical protein
MPHLFVHSPVDGYLGYFFLLVIVNNAAMKIDVQISESLFQFFEHT